MRLGVVIVSLVLGFINFQRSYVFNLDAYKFGITARELLAGKGFTTRMPMPSQAEAPGIENYPTRSSKLLWIATLAGAFHFFGDQDWVLQICSLFFLIPLLIYTFLLARSLFDENVALLASLLVLCNGFILHTSISGRSESLFNALIVAHLYYFLQFERGRSLVLSALCLILAIYTRGMNFFFIGIFWSFVLAVRRDRFAIGVMFFSGLLLLPLFFWNQASYGSPVHFYAIQKYGFSENLTSAKALAENTMMLRQMGEVHGSGLTFMVQHPNVMVLRFWQHLIVYAKQLIFFPNAVISCGFLLSLLMVPLIPSARRLWYLTLFYALGVAFGGLFTVPLSRYFGFAIPLMAILAVAFYRDLFLHRISNLRLRLVVGLLLLLLLAQSMRSMMAYPSKLYAEQFKAKLTKFITDNCPPEAVLVTDVPAIVAWKTKHLAFLVPDSLQNLRKLKQLKSVDYLLITLTDAIEESEKEWTQLMSQPQDYPGLHYLAKLDSVEQHKRFAVLYKIE
jgi:hypothetical protein